MLVRWKGIIHYPGVRCRGAFERGTEMLVAPVEGR